MKKNKKNITEARAKVTMDKYEKKVHTMLMNLLKDDGQGHHHAAYAECLKDFVINIIPAENDPEFTASMDFDHSIIRISSGFLNKGAFNQLSVLLRHELAHALMMHQIRMMNVIISKYGEKGYTRISYSMSLSRLENVIADYEISNKRYSDEDKKTVKNMWLNGHVIGGLVTETTTADGKRWREMSIEQMYEALDDEIKQLQKAILADWDAYQENGLDSSKLAFYDDEEQVNKLDQVKVNIANANFYSRNLDGSTNFFGTIDQFLDGKALYHFFPMDKHTKAGTIPALYKVTSLPEEWVSIIKDINTYYKENEESDLITKQDAKDMIWLIARSNPSEKVDVITKYGKTITDVMTPEEKLIAIDTIKAIIPSLEAYKTWYEKVQKVLSDSKYSQEDVDNILKKLEGEPN